MDRFWCTQSNEKKKLQIEKIELAAAYENKICLSKNESKDLKELLNKNQIPSLYANFY